MAVTPVFYTIESLYYRGYNLTQRGCRVVLEAEDIDNPFQLWYKDDSWRFVNDTAGNSAFALINNGSKAALQANSDTVPKVSLACDYDCQKDTGNTFLWTLQDDQAIIFSVALTASLRLGLGNSPPKVGDGVAAILGTGSSSTRRWSLNPFEPKSYRIQSLFAQQILVAKPPHENVTFKSGAGSFDNELTVVVVNNANQNENQEVWYRVPAGSPLENSNSSFILISKKNGKALKASTKSGDKVILTEFDPLDNNFVWSQDRALTAGQEYLAINLANSKFTLHWHVPGDGEYQNAAYNHPLVLRPVTASETQSQWKFIALTS